MDGRDDDRAVVRTLVELGQKILDAMKQDTAAIIAAIQADAPPVEPPIADTLTLSYSIGGTQMGAAISGAIGNTASPTVVESNSTTPSIAPIGPVIFASDTPSVVSVDPNSGVATLVSAGTANVSALDQGNGLTDTVAFTVTAAPPPVATAMSLNYALNATRKR